MLLFIIILIAAALCTDALWRVTIAAMLWAPALYVAVAAMHWTASLHLADPLAPLYAFVVAAMAARFVQELVTLCIFRRT